jgi:three-Cys-motif partner protein
VRVEANYCTHRHNTVPIQRPTRWIEIEEVVGKLIDGDDGLPVEEVGVWAKDKLSSLCRYIDISRAVRRKWIGPGKGGATYIDLFCSTGRAKIRSTGEFIDGSCVSAWKESQKATPFSQIYIADLDPDRRAIAVERLRRLHAPVIEIEGNALQAAVTIRKHLSSQGLHFCFIDPYSLGAFDFGILRTFSGLRFIDMLVHISKMDLQRNTKMNVRAQQSDFDRFAPGWKSSIDITQRHSTVRRSVFEYWRSEVEQLGISTAAEMELITGEQGQHLYWLTLIAKSELAHAFWKAAVNKTGQGNLF